VDSVGHVNPLKNLSSSRINSAEIDITPLGRQETWEDSPEGYPQTPPYKWWNWHDNYGAEASPDPKCVEVSDAGEAAFRKSDAEAKA
jgi:hypothetical protein